MRTRQFLLLGYVLACVVYLMARYVSARQVPAPPPAPALVEVPITPSVVEVPLAGAPAWFESMKPYCNALEVVTRVRQSPPPAGTGGAGYGAACFALGGMIDSAAAMIDRLPSGSRHEAANIVFAVGHPVADAGDDRSAGPMMALVVRYQADNYMALYHAGMAEYAIGEAVLARKHLRRFMELYSQEDGWRSSARGALERLGVNE